MNRAEDDIQQAILLLQKLQPAQLSANTISPKKDPNDVEALRQLILKKKQIELSKQVRFQTATDQIVHKLNGDLI